MDPFKVFPCFAYLLIIACIRLFQESATTKARELRSKITVNFSGEVTEVNVLIYNPKNLMFCH